MAVGRGGDRQEIAVLAVCLGLSVLLLAFGGRLDSTWLARGEQFVLWPANRARSFVESVALERGENRRLKIEVLQLKSERALLVRAAAEAERLRRALRFAEPQGPVLCPARVEGVVGEPWPQLYRLSIGTESGVRVGQPVVAPEGLVGRVSEVGAGRSSVTLLTDPVQAVACEVLPGGARGVLRFRAEERPGLYLSLVPLTDTVRVGQEVVTSGLSVLFPEGLPVGSVTRVGRDPNGLVQEIAVRPYAPLTRQREVFVVVDVAHLAPWPAEAVLDSTARADSVARAAALARADSLARAAALSRADSLARAGGGPRP
jgi:rod shape-determining protein MreC